MVNVIEEVQASVVLKLTFESCWHLVFYHLVVMRYQPLLIETLLVYEAGLSSSTGGCWNCPRVDAKNETLFYTLDTKTFT